MLETGERPAGVSALVPMLTRGNDETAQGPLAELHARAQAAARAGHGILDVSIFNVNPFIDGAGVGQTVLVYARDASALPRARALAADLAQSIWDGRNRYVHALPDIDTLLRQHDGSPRRLIVGDFGDRVLAGGPGDSLHVLDRALALTRRRVAAIVTDPEALRQCQQAGLGAQWNRRLAAIWRGLARRSRYRAGWRPWATAPSRNRGAFMRGQPCCSVPMRCFATRAMTC